MGCAANAAAMIPLSASSQPFLANAELPVMLIHVSPDDPATIVLKSFSTMQDWVSLGDAASSPEPVRLKFVHSDAEKLRCLF